MGLFDNAKSVVLNNKEVKSIFIGQSILYEQSSNQEEQGNNSLILTYTGNVFYASSFTLNSEDMEHEFSVDWGDGSEIETKTMGNDTGILHEYNTTGNYTITIRGLGTNIEVVDNSTLALITGLTSVIIPNTVTTIEDTCFYGCTDLTSVTIPNSVTSIGESCFAGCSGLKSIIIPSSVTSIGDYCFVDCTGLERVIFEGTTPPQLGEESFFDSNDNFIVYVPIGSLSVYEEDSNYPSRLYVEGTPQPLIIIYNYDNENGNGAITTSDDDYPITFTGDSLSIDWGDGSQVETYTDGRLSHDYEEIGTYTISITGNITGFSAYAFSERWGMTSITIPNTITSLSGIEFSGVTTLTSIKFTSLTPPTLEEEFIQISNLETIYVPTGSLSAYQNAENFPANVVFVEY